MGPGHLVQGAVADDSSIVDEDLDRTNGGFNLPNTFGARIEIAHVPAVNVNPSPGMEGVGGVYVARVGGGDAITGFGERLGNSGPMPRVPPETNATRAIDLSSISRLSP